MMQQNKDKFLYVILSIALLVLAAMFGMLALLQGRTTPATPAVAQDAGAKLPVVAHHTDFKAEASADRPEVFLKTWEITTSLRPVDAALYGKAASKGDEVTWSNAVAEWKAYPLAAGEGMENGGFEFEVVWKSPPATNIVRMVIDTGVDYFYQPPLILKDNEEAVSCNPQGTECYDKEGGVVVSRPENVVGSYAAYHKTKQGHVLGKTDYKTGKAFHIYRPKAIDAVGNWTWAEISINQISGLLTITVPQAFFDGATYPVTVDPTIGYTSIGASSAGSQLPKGSEASPASSGDVTKLTAYIDASVADRPFGAALYNSDASLALVAEDSGNGIVPTTPAWTDINLAAAVIGGTTYLLAIWQPFSDGRTLFYDTEIAAGFADSGNIFETWPDPFVKDFTIDRRHSIYATYTESGGEPTPTPTPTPTPAPTQAWHIIYS